jgi:hypothetical protein
MGRGQPGLGAGVHQLDPPHVPRPVARPPPSVGRRIPSSTSRPTSSGATWARAASSASVKEDSSIATPSSRQVFRKSLGRRGMGVSLLATMRA